ncbi:MAG: hypothetical protein Kow0090_20930 [Myxococcota bacterium]
MKVLVVFHGLLPRADAPATGSGMRANAIANGLKERGHEIALCSPYVNLERYGIPLQKAAAEAPFDFYYFETKDDLYSIFSTFSPDVIVVQQWEALNFIEDDLDIPIAVDLYAPRPIEDQFAGVNLGFKLVDYISLLKKADFFFCAGERQRYFYLGWLMFAGVNMQRIPIEVVPLAVSPEIAPPEKKNLPPEGPVFLTAGYKWRWQEHTPPLKSLISTLDAAKRGSLEIYAGQYLLAEKERKNADNEQKILMPENSRVKTHPVVSLGELEAAMRRAHVAFDLFTPNSERELAVPFRTLHYLSMGLPVIIGKERELANEIKEANAGFVVDPYDDKEIVGLCTEIVNHPLIALEKAQNAFELARTKYNWELAIDPLDEFVTRPKKRRLKNPTFIDLFTEAIVGQAKTAADSTQRLENEAKYWRDRAWALEREKLQERSASEWDKARLVQEKEKEKELLSREKELLIDEYKRQIEEKVGEIKEKANSIADKDKYIDSLRRAIDGYIKELTTLEHRLAQVNMEKERELSALREELREKTTYLEMITNSRPYKLFKLLKGG